MRRLLSLTMARTLAAIALLAVGSHAGAQSSRSSLPTSYREGMPTFMRAGPLLGPGFMTAKPTNDNLSEQGTMSYVGGVTLGLGSGSFSMESGLMYMRLANLNKIKSQNATYNILMDAEYVGVPVWAKYNYFEKARASFFVKAGAIPSFLVGQSISKMEMGDTGLQKFELNGTDVLATGGIGGTAPLGETSVFVLDLSYFQGTMETTPGGATNSGALLLMGVHFGI